MNFPKTPIWWLFIGHTWIVWKDDIQIKMKFKFYGFKRVLRKYTIKAAVRLCMQKWHRIYPTESLQVRNRGTVMNSEKLIYFNISLQMCLKPFPAKNLINKLVKSVSAFCFSCALFVFTEKKPCSHAHVIHDFRIQKGTAQDCIFRSDGYIQIQHQNSL